PKRHKTFLKRQRLFSETEEITDSEMKLVKERLKKQRYKVREEDGHLLAEKGRFSRWGPYVNHIGLIIILLAAIVRMTPLLYMDEYVWVREGEQKVLPGTDSEYYIENKQFILETHDEEDERFKEAIENQGMITSNYQTDIVIYKTTDTDGTRTEPELEKYMESSRRLNEPLKFDGYTLYQAGYQLNEIENMTFNIYDIDDLEENLDQFSIDLINPKSSYELENGFQVEVEDYFPDYIMDDGEPRSESKYPRNPAFVFKITPPDSDETEISFIGIGKNIDATGENQYKLGIEAFESRNVSGISVKRDKTLPFFIIGAAIFMIGVIQGMYWHHRRIWVHPTEKGLLLAAHTNKNWFGIQKDIEKVIDGTKIKMVEDQKELDK